MRNPVNSERRVLQKRLFLDSNTVMRIFCIGRNYAEHISELGNDMPENPVVFMKPETALVESPAVFPIPSFSNDIHHEVELVLKISKPGKNIEESKAIEYFSEIALGIDFTARDVQSVCKEKRISWEIAKAFDKSAPIGAFRDLPNNIDALDFSLEKNGVAVQIGNTNLMMFSFSKIISYLSEYFELLPGDLIYTGTPSGVGRVESGDILIGKIGNEICLEVTVK